MGLSTPDRKISESLRGVADGLDEALEEIAGQKMQFSLIVFQTEPDSRMNYISNCQRDDVVAAMKSLLDGWEQGMPDIKAHELQS